MDWRKLIDLKSDFFQKYRYAILLLLVGILLLIKPAEEPPVQSVVQPVETGTVQSRDIQAELETLLSRLEGAGKVRVLLTQASGEEISYQTDEDIQTEENGRDIRRDTVVITDENRAQKGLIQRIDPPVYLGAVILCQGADRASVRLSIVEAVKSATGLPANRITVLKMK